MLGATIVGHPLQEHARTDLGAMAVIAAIGAIEGHIAPFDVAVGMVGAVRTHDARPAFVIRRGQQHALRGQPREHVVLAGVVHADRAQHVSLLREGRHAQGGADLVQRVFDLRIEFCQYGLEAVHARFVVHGTR